VPVEFDHPALQELVRIGTTHGSVDSEQLRVALVQAEISPKKMKVVLRSLDQQGIHVTLDAATAHRAVAATTTRASATVSATKKATAKKTAAEPDEAKTAAATKTAAAKTATAKTAAAKSTAPKATVAAAHATRTAAAAGVETDTPKAPAKKSVARKPAGKKAAARKGSDDADALVDHGVDDDAKDEADEAKAKAKAAEDEGDETKGFVMRDDDEDDAPAQQVVTAGATADPVKDCTKLTDKVKKRDVDKGDLDSARGRRCANAGGAARGGARLSLRVALPRGRWPAPPWPGSTRGPAGSSSRPR